MAVLLYYFKHYPFSMIVVGLVLYFSFFTPVSFDIPPFPYYDKIAHFCMYGGLSGMLWVEFLWNHRKDEYHFLRGLLGATLMPICFGGVIELLQEYVTPNRTGDWLDFLANSTASVVAMLIAWFMIRPLLIKYYLPEKNPAS